MTIDKWWKSYATDEELREQAKSIVFKESEVTLELLAALSDRGIRNINIVSDEEYESHMFERWLQEMSEKETGNER